MKNLLISATVGMALSGMLAVAQDTSDPVVSAVSFTAPSQQHQAYAASDVKIVGTIDSGQTTKPVAYTSSPRYRAFVFEGNGHDQVEVAVSGLNGKAFVAVADSSLNLIASGTGRLTATLPYHGPDTEAFYIVFKGAGNQPSRLAVHLKKVPAAQQAADATR